MHSELECHETPFGTELVLTTSHGRVVVSGDQGSELVEALIKWMGVDEVMITVNEWCHRRRLAMWERME